MTVPLKIRRARLSDVPALLPMMARFNHGEGIPWRPRRVIPALRHLLGHPRLGSVLVAEGSAPPRLIGYAVATYNYDLEFAGPDAFVTEIYVRPGHRGRGLGRRLLEATAGQVSAGGARALHLLVKPGNRHARLLYERSGFEVVPRLMMTRPLA